MENVTKEEIIAFEERIKRLWDSAELPYPIHLSGGNEEPLIDIFRRVNPGDYIFSTHRSHYHYLLAGGSPEKLERMIREGRSMHVFDKDLNFLSSAIVGGTCGMAAGVAQALKLDRSNKRVWCFVGDGAEDEGHFYEAVRYVDGRDLPCKFIIEDNNLSVETTKEDRYGDSEINWPDCVERYHYQRVYPHVGSGEWVDFSGRKAGGPSF